MIIVQAQILLKTTIKIQISHLHLRIILHRQINHLHLQTNQLLQTYNSKIKTKIKQRATTLTLIHLKIPAIEILTATELQKIKQILKHLKVLLLNNQFILLDFHLHF